MNKLKRHQFLHLTQEDYLGLIKSCCFQIVTGTLNKEHAKEKLK